MTEQPEHQGAAPADAGRRGHVLRSEVTVIFLGLLLVGGTVWGLYTAGFEIRDWSLARSICAQAVYDPAPATGAPIRIYTGRVVPGPGAGVLSAAKPRVRERHTWHTGRLLFVSNDQGVIFAVSKGPSLVPKGATVSFCGFDHGAVALWTQAGYRIGPGRYFGAQPIWGEPEGGYHRVRWIDGTVQY